MYMFMYTHICTSNTELARGIEKRYPTENKAEETRSKVCEAFCKCRCYVQFSSIMTYELSSFRSTGSFQAA